MRIKSKFEIIGHGKYLPENKILSATIEKNLGLEKNWILDNVGVKVRHQVKKHETNSFMGARAVEKALVKANISLSEVDYLIGASATFDCPLPNKSSLIKKEMEGTEKYNFPCIDINTSCLSFVTALDYAARLFYDSDIDTIVIVSSEIASYGLNPENSETFSLFGDAAVSFILRKTSKNKGLVAYEMNTYSEGAEWTIIEGGGNRYPIKNNPYDKNLHTFKMEGSKLLKFSSKLLPNFMNDFFKKNNIKPDEIQVIVPHQASKFGIKLLHKYYPNKEVKIVNELSKFGNCIAAAIPLALANAIEKNEIKEGDNCFLIGTAAGLSIGGLILKF